MRRYSSLTLAERRRSDRRLRLTWASSGDLEHAAAVERLIDHGANVDRRRHGAGRLERAELEYGHGLNLTRVPIRSVA